MEAFTLDPTVAAAAEDLVGVVICEEVKSNGRRLFHKGHRLREADLAALPLIGRPVHAVRLDLTDVHEDEAGARLAAAVGVGGVFAKGPVQSRYNLIAETKGLLRVDRDAVIALNRLESIAVFTLPDRLAILPGKIVAGVKITPVAVAESTLREAEALARQSAVVQVLPFQPRNVGVITTEGLSGKTRDRFREVLERKIGWYGSRVLRFEDIASEPDVVAETMRAMIAEGADLILTGGGNTIDPLDAALLALPQIGATMVKFGAPAHPGSMFWLAYRGETPIFNLASCSMYSKATVADLVLPWIMAGERITLDHLAELGYSGLLDRDMGFRFPPYESDATVEDEE